MQPPTSNQLLSRYTWRQEVIAELQRYTDNRFKAITQPEEAGATSQISFWNRCVAEAHHMGVFEALKQYFPQLHFPIRAGISQTEPYKNATLRGLDVTNMDSATGLELQQADQLQLYLHDSFAGTLPVLVVKDCRDFQSIVQALSYRNEANLLPSSMGAAIIRGLNNWYRLRELQQRAAVHPSSNDWQQLLQQKSLYQDTLIVLSEKPYSGVSATALGLQREEWLRLSTQLRLQHECAHYFTLRHFGSMSNNMHDELIADYAGIVSVLPAYRADWFLHFIGLENYPNLRADGRLNNYRGTPPLSSSAFELLGTIVCRAALNVEQFDRALGTDPTGSDLPNRLQALCLTPLVEMASERGNLALLSTYEKIRVMV